MGQPKAKHRGIQNAGNTCWFNSAVHFMLALPGLVATLFTTSKEASARSDQLHHIRSGPIQQTTEAFRQFAKDLLRPDASTAVGALTFLTALHATNKPIFNFDGAIKDPAEALAELQDVLDPTLFKAI